MSKTGGLEEGSALLKANSLTPQPISKSKSFDYDSEKVDLGASANKFNTTNSTSSGNLKTPRGNNSSGINLKIPLESDLSNLGSPLTYYEQWYEYDKRRKELTFNIRQSIQLLENRYSFQRERGLDKLVGLLSEISTSMDKDMFTLIHKKVDQNTNGRL